MKLSEIMRCPSAAQILRRQLPEEDRDIRQVCNLSMVSSAFSADTLYVSTLSNFLSLRASSAPSIFFLIMDEDALVNRDRLPMNYVLFSRDTSVNALYVRMMSLLEESDRVTSAKLIISQALLDGTSVSDMLEIASELFDNPVLLQDYTTRLLAHSAIPKGTDDDEILNSVFTKGYVTADLFSKYDYEKVLSEIEHTPETILVESTKKTSRLICRLRVNRQYFGWVLTVATRHAFRDGDIEIMNYLSGALTLILERRNLLPNTSLAENLLRELLANPGEYTTESFTQRAQGFGWTIRGPLLLMGISFQKEEEEGPRTLMAYKNHLSLMLPDAKIFFKGDAIYLLMKAAKPSAADAVPQSFLEKFHLRMAVGNIFSDIMQLPAEFEYVNATLMLSARLKKEGTRHYFSDFVEYHALLKLSEIYDKRVLCQPELIAVVRYDRQFGTELARTKRVFILAGSTTKAVKQLNIHPNTLQYRLHRFQEISGLSGSINDPLENFRLLRSYLMLDLFPELAED